MSDIFLKRNDTGVGVIIQLRHYNGIVNLEGAQPRFNFDDKSIASEISDADNGEIMVVFDKYHTQKSGRFKAEVEVLFPDGRLETYPNNSYITLKISDDIGGR